MTGAYDIGRRADIDEHDLNRVQTHEDAAHVVEQMHADLLAHAEEWENHTLDHFLDALAALLGSLHNVYHNQGEPMPEPSWALFAKVLVSATGYE